MIGYVMFAEYLRRRQSVSPNARILLSLGGKNPADIRKRIKARIQIAGNAVKAAKRQPGMEKRQHIETMNLKRTINSPEEQEKELSGFKTRMKVLELNIDRAEDALLESVADAEENHNLLERMIKEWENADYSLPELDKSEWMELGNGCHQKSTYKNNA